MRELTKATKKIEKILINAEDTGESFDVTLGNLSEVKVHGVVFPRLMLIEIMDDFVEDREKRKVRTDDEVQEAYDNAAMRWNKVQH